MNTFFLLTFGCPKNEVVSENISKILLEYQFQQTLEIDKADLIAINTCGFIGSAISENLKTIKEILKTKKHNSKLVIFGCIPQRFFDPEILAQEHPYIKNVNAWCVNLEALKKFIKTNYLEAKFIPIVENRISTNSPFAYLKIAEGCSQNCAFCTIPSFKGSYKSKNEENILTEIEELMNFGTQEIVLIAQETTFYGQDLEGNHSLTILLKKIITEFPDLPRIRILYAHPNGINKELVQTIAENPQVCPYLDIPLQHIDNEILENMNRPYDDQKIKKTITNLRKKIPSLSLRSTFIVGYPGETETQFEKLLKFIEETQFDHAGFFAYEKELGTPAANLENQVPEKIKKIRLEKVYQIQEKISTEKLKRMIGKKVEILTEFQDEEFTYGRTTFQAPEIDGYVKVKGDLEIGKFIKIKIEKLEYPNLIGG